MITARELKQRMDEQPFRPFTITMSDGRRFDVMNHDSAFVTRNIVTIGTVIDTDSVWEKYVNLSILHITSLEDIHQGKAA